MDRADRNEDQREWTTNTNVFAYTMWAWIIRFPLICPHRFVCFMSIHGCTMFTLCLPPNWWFFITIDITVSIPRILNDPSRYSVMLCTVRICPCVIRPRCWGVWCKLFLILVLFHSSGCRETSDTNETATRWAPGYMNTQILSQIIPHLLSSDVAH